VRRFLKLIRSVYGYTFTIKISNTIHSLTRYELNNNYYNMSIFVTVNLRRIILILKKCIIPTYTHEVVDYWRLTKLPLFDTHSVTHLLTNYYLDGTKIIAYLRIIWFVLRPFNFWTYFYYEIFSKWKFPENYFRQLIPVITGYSQQLFFPQKRRLWIEANK